MQSIKTNGDSIAHEFSKLMGNAPGINKTASTNEPPPITEDAVDDFADDELEGLIVDDMDEAVDGAEDISEIIDSVDDLGSYASRGPDSSEDYVIDGLAKIASSLRAKGEGFAADVVEATANSIEGDLVKESGRKEDVLTSLNKIASELVDEGDSFAADMVRVTINKLGY